MSLARGFHFNQRFLATLRWDVFNIFDSVNLGIPNKNISATNVATITSLAGDGRVMQFSVRLGF